MLIVGIKCFCLTWGPETCFFASDTEFLLEISGSEKQLRRIVSFSGFIGKFTHHLFVYARKPNLGEEDSNIPNAESCTV